VKRLSRKLLEFAREDEGGNGLFGERMDEEEAGEWEVDDGEDLKARSDGRRDESTKSTKALSAPARRVDPCSIRLPISFSILAKLLNTLC